MKVYRLYDKLNKKFIEIRVGQLTFFETIEAAKRARKVIFDKEKYSIVEYDLIFRMELE